MSPVCKKILCKDGGFATQLTKHVGESVDGDPLWSAKFNSTNPDAVIATHLDYLNAGADIILTNTYQTSVEGYGKYLNLNERESIELIKKTVHLAHLARNKYVKENKINEIPMIVGSIGPYGAHLHDGSEYTGSYADMVGIDIIKNWHRNRIQAVLEAGVDALAIETIPCLVEARAVVDLLCDEYPDVKFWVSLQCKVDVKTLAHGETFRDACLTIWNDLKKRNATNNCIAIGVNCLHPRFVTPIFKSVNGDREKNERIPFVVYPNSGEIYDIKTGWHGKEDCIPLKDYVNEWVDLGAIIIGGCCRTYAQDIQQIKKTIDEVNVKLSE